MIIIVDNLSFRASCVASLLSKHPDTSFSKIYMCSSRELAEGKIDPSMLEEKLSIFLYHAGGRALSDNLVRSAIETCILRASGRPVAVLTDALDDADISLAIKIGVSGLLPTDMSADAVVAALRFIKVGGKFFPPMNDSRMTSYVAQSVVDVAEIDVAKKFGTNSEFNDKRNQAYGSKLSFEENESSVPSDDCNDFEIVLGDRKISLTARQYEVLQLLQRGMSNKCIGKELNLSESTVKLHVRQLLRKLEASNRTQVALMASSSEDVTAGVRHSISTISPTSLRRQSKAI